MAHLGQLVLVFRGGTTGGQVGPGTEVSAGTGDDHHTVLGAAPDLLEGGQQFVPHDGVDGVLAMRAVEGDGHHAGVVALDDDRLQRVGGRHAPTIHNDAVGFDATRKQVKRKTDILFVVGAIAAAVALVAWGFFG